ncbi:MAG: hypothetical protein OXI66_02575 [Boseongicola sp.]|nr:hypothetical protein [Boseongicola sp.]
MGGWPISSASLFWKSAEVTKSMNARPSSGFGASAGTASSHAPSIGLDPTFCPGAATTSIIPGTRDFSGSSSEGAQDGHSSIDMAVVPCISASRTSEEL